MNEGEAFKLIDEALSALDPDAQGRIIAWANQKFAGAPQPSALHTYASSAVTATAAKPAKKKKKTTPSGTKKPKVMTKPDKDINLFPTDKQTSLDFAKEKSPANLKQKGVVAIYYIRDILGYEHVGMAQVAAFFKAVGWPMPADLPNTLQQAGTEGWLDTSDSDDLKITSVGENLVEHQLPTKKAS
jgi:hypothetical protein